MSHRSVICRNLLEAVQAKMIIQTFVITARRRSCLMSWKQHVNTGHKRTRGKRRCFFFVIRKNILYISSFLNFCFFLSVMEAELKKKYCNITPQVIDLFLAVCEQCQLKKKTPKQGLVVHPITLHEFSVPGRLD